MKNCAIVIPVYRTEPTETETASLQQCSRVLSRHPAILVGPEGLDFTKYLEIRPNAEVLRFPDANFLGLAEYSRLLLSYGFYKKFATFNYILIYQPDAYVFSDELDFWCSQEYDFLGAPWFEGMGIPKPDPEYVGVGNGGFSLRNVQSFMRVIRSFRFLKPPITALRTHVWTHGRRTALQALVNASVRNCTWNLANSFTGYEDLFWGLVCPKMFKWFRVAAPDVALRFSFEVNPRLLFSRNNSRLPFGCHAWEKYDAPFWESYINVARHE